MIRLSETIAPTLRELNLAYVRQQTIRSLELRINELKARQAFHQDPTPANLTAWCDAQALVEES